MSSAKKLLISIAVVGMIIGVVFVAVSAARFYLGSARQNATSNACGTHRGATHRVMIRDGKVQPESVTAKVCDTLIIENGDDIQRRLAFGEHDHHVSYDGSEGKLVSQNETLTLVLAKTGDFMFHDHFDEQVHGHFTVTK
jgi:hypothetical protein